MIDLQAALKFLSMEECGTTKTAEFDTDTFVKSSWEHRPIHLQFHRPLLAIVRQVRG